MIRGVIQKTLRLKTTRTTFLLERRTRKRIPSRGPNPAILDLKILYEVVLYSCLLDLAHNLANHGMKS